MNGISARREGRVLHIVLDRPEKLNAVNAPMLAELKRLLDAAAEDLTSVIVIGGAGRAFCSGGDLSGKNTGGAGELANDVVRAIIESPKPVIAAVHGAAAGVGCPIALSCDLTVVAESAYFQLAFSRVGLMPDGGTSALLSAAIGRPRATRMAMLAEKISAADAYAWGMITHLAEDGKFELELASVVSALNATSGPSLQWIKRAMRAGTMSALEEVQSIELTGQTDLAGTPEFRNAVAAYRDAARDRRST
ncbi:enoyl-CoA hydratase/isomerase family protein [Mycobacterium sp. SMC-8]|uniref:enoyl-CoA hydratase-related protein n=1 Tax=Mycobacterium sp. SMC-8 TaxID=2857060 RepID=UPI0021B4380A|nr:enoyl-CoA hydratase-related protein [Mycobacterium sp. SMC-8]UXA11550.1 enoyl-CoA hydratase/isomerase family protein [Mycobacterium sp. SMC-8]